jgi:hypothetical protein
VNWSDEAERQRAARDRLLTQTCAREDKAWWWVSMREGNRSAFSGYHWTPSAYSEVRCARPSCGRKWRTTAAYVAGLPDQPEDTRGYQADQAAEGGGAL